MPLLKGVPDWALYAGGGVVLGGGYLLLKKRKASTTGSAPASSPSVMATGADQQQSSIAPYYLTGNTGNQGTSGGYGGRGIGTTQGPPLPVPSGPPGGSGVDITSGSVLPSIPPILPNVNTTPQPAISQPAPTPAPTPAPAPQQDNNLPADLLAKITANGEKIVSSVASPNGGVWYLGNKGGVFAINAPFYGSPAGQYYWGSRTGLQIVPSGNGYTVVASSGERYNYGA